MSCPPCSSYIVYYWRYFQGLWLCQGSGKVNINIFCYSCTILYLLHFNNCHAVIACSFVDMIIHIHVWIFVLLLCVIFHSLILVPFTLLSAMVLLYEGYRKKKKAIVIGNLCLGTKPDISLSELFLCFATNPLRIGFLEWTVNISSLWVSDHSPTFLAQDTPSSCHS